MADTFRYRHGETNPVTAAVDSATVIEVGDLLYLDTDDVKPASSQTDQTSEQANQRLFAQNFIGVSGERSASGDTDPIRIDTDGVFEFDCASETHEVGDLLGVDEASSGTALEDQKLVKVVSRGDAVAVCVDRDASAATTVKVRLLTRIAGLLPLPNPTLLGYNIETLTANKTLVNGDAQLQVLDPGGAGRTVTLPAEATSDGQMFIIVNSADAAEVLTVEDDGTNTICTPTQAEAAIVVCDGTSWHGLVGASS